MTQYPLTPPTAAVLEVLALPDLATLAYDRARGAECVWCGERMTVRNAVDLGRRVEGGRWYFPRACRPCTTNAAHQALRYGHGGSCEQCADEAARCPARSALYQFLRDYWRAVRDAGAPTPGGRP